MKKKRLLLLTSGGDSPGMNAAIRSVVRVGHYYDFQVFACHDGYQGLVNQTIFPMNPPDVANCIQRGGTIIKSNRSEEFHHREIRDKCRAFLAHEEIEYLVPIGGDGTFRGAALLEQEGGPKTIGIPGTIDNDIVGTDYTIGYDTALNNAVNAIDKIRDTAASNSLYFLVETMGRSSGLLAAEVALASGAEYVLTPEFTIATRDLAKKILAPKRKKNSLIIIVAEAGHSGRSFNIARELKTFTPSIEYRVCVLGHIQRGGSPTAIDRTTASTMGSMAVGALLQGKSRCMTALQHGKYTLEPFPDITLPAKRLANEDLIKLITVLAT